jgi:hypothetical protein
MAGLRIRITSMRIRIQLFIFKRIRVQLFTLMQIRILLLIKVTQICAHWSTYPPVLLSLHASIVSVHGPLGLHLRLESSRILP